MNNVFQNLLACDVKDLQKQAEKSRDELLPMLQKSLSYRSFHGSDLIYISHPLMNCLFTGDAYWHNAAFLQQVVRLQKLVKRKEWDSIFLIPRPYRFDFFKFIKDKIDDKQYWRILGLIWVDSENLWQIKGLRSLLSTKRSYREYMMTEDERQHFDSLPDELQLFRGCTKLNEKGFSWTLDIGVATRFATRFKNGSRPEAQILTTVYKREKAIAYFNRRYEEEIIIDPSRIKVRQYVRIPKAG